MLDSVIKLVEKAAELLRYRSERREKRFASIVDPMYAGLKVVHQDYLQFFERADADLQSGKSLVTIASDFRTRRLVEEAERRSITAQARAFMDEDGLEEFHSFFEAISNYFNHTPLSDGGLSASTLIQMALQEIGEGGARGKDKRKLVAVLEKLRNRDSARAEKLLSDAIRASLGALRGNWGEISALYAKLRAGTVK